MPSSSRLRAALCPKGNAWRAFLLAPALLAFTLLVVELVDLPFVKIAGGLLLLWIAVRLAGAQEPQKEIKPAKRLWSAIRIIAMADAVMSLDNMLAIAAAAKGSMLLILFGRFKGLQLL
jgi:predicted tellurium resistance membrane protein TerC